MGKFPMGKTKHIPPIPTDKVELAKRVIQLEEDGILRRKRKAESMRRYREKLKLRDTGAGGATA